jgi:hypothetical protein
MFVWGLSMTRPGCRAGWRRFHGPVPLLYKRGTDLLRQPFAPTANSIYLSELLDAYLAGTRRHTIYLS